MDPAEGAPYLLQLLGIRDGTERLAVLSPEAIKARTFETQRQLGLKGSRRRPWSSRSRTSTGSTRRRTSTWARWSKAWRVPLSSSS